MTAMLLEGPRGARPEELDDLIRLLDSVFRPQAQSMACEHGCMYCSENAAFLRVMLSDGIPVSHVGLKLWEVFLLGVPLRLASVGGVCTHPDFRGKGLATVLLKDAEHLVRARGVDLVLVSGGRGLYTTNGYAPAGCYREFLLDAAVAARFAKAEFQVRRYTSADLRWLAMLSEREPVRYHRPLDELERLIAGRTSRSIPDELVVVSRSGQDLAWLDLATEPGGKPSTLWEYAGDRDAVLSGLSQIMRQKGFSSLNVSLPEQDCGLISRLETVKEGKKTAMPGHTVKILDFRGFMEKMRPVFRQRVADALLNGLSLENAGAGGTIRMGSESLTLSDPREVVQLVFGSGEQGRGGDPVVAGSRIAEFVRNALPLPLVCPGVNYV